MRHLIFGAILLAWVCRGAMGATLHVPADYPTIGQAITFAQPGDEIVVSPGTYDGFGNVGKRLTIRSSFDGKDWSLVENTIVKKTIMGSIAQIYATPDTSGTVIRGFHFTRDPLPNPPYGYDGRGIVSDGAPYATIEDCIIENCIHTPDMQGHNGGGAAIVGISGMIQNNIIRNNRATGGAAIDGGRSLVQNNVIYNNTGSSIIGTTGEILNNTVYDVGGIDVASTVINNIFWHNSSGPFSYTGYPPMNCLIKGYSGPGSNIFTADPQFVDPANGDFHLKSTSPCIDAGLSTTTTNAVKSDFEGVQRGLKGNAALPGPGKIDIGAFEYIPKPVAV